MSSHHFVPQIPTKSQELAFVARERDRDQLRAQLSLDVSKASILSIGAVRISGKRVKTSDRLDIALKPPADLTAESIKIHKIRAQDLAEGIELRDALEQFDTFSHVLR